MIDTFAHGTAPHDVVVDEATNRLFVQHHDIGIRALDAATGSLLATFPVLGVGIAFDPVRSGR